MMNFWINTLLALVVGIGGWRAGFCFLKKLFEYNENAANWINICNRIFAYMLDYLIFFIIFMFIKAESFKHCGIESDELYLTYLIIGMSLSVWSYFECVSHKKLPRIIRDKKTMAIKKIMVYIPVFVISVSNGYYQFLKFFGENVNLDANTAWIANSSVVLGVIAFDRIWNQIKELTMKEKKK